MIDNDNQLEEQEYTDKSGGFVSIFRKIWDSDLWNENRVFSKFEAWLDLLLMAQWKDYHIENFMTIKRGQMITSMDKLKRRWNWSKKKVWTFLRQLEDKGRIKRKQIGKRSGTLISIVKYDIYNKPKKEKETVKETQKKQSGNSQETHNNKDNNINNINNNNIKEESITKVINNSECFKKALNQPTYKKWVSKLNDLYDFDICEQILKADIWYMTRPEKIPKKNFLNALTRWFNNCNRFSNNNNYQKNGSFNDGNTGQVTETIDDHKTDIIRIREEEKKKS